MSGGTFDYIQYKLDCVIEDIERYISQNNVEIPDEQLDPIYQTKGDKYSEYSDETIAVMNNANKIIKIARIYIQRIDWLLAGDDSEANLHKRLHEDLDE